MKKRMYIAWICILCWIVVGCSSGSPASAKAPEDILSQIWAQYNQSEKFAVYGGSPSDGITDAPGKLPDKTAWKEKFLLPENKLSAIDAAASLTHMMNSNVFTAGVFRLTGNVNVKSLSTTVRDNIKSNPWLCGSPEKLLIAAPEGGQLLIAYGSQDAITLLYSKLLSTFPETTLYCHQDI